MEAAWLMDRGEVLGGGRAESPTISSASLASLVSRVRYERILCLQEAALGSPIRARSLKGPCRPCPSQHRPPPPQRGLCLQSPKARQTEGARHTAGRADASRLPLPLVFLSSSPLHGLGLLSCSSIEGPADSPPGNFPQGPCCRVPVPSTVLWVFPGPDGREPLSAEQRLGRAVDPARTW